MNFIRLNLFQRACSALALGCVGLAGTFSMPAQQATTLPATNITPTSARLNGEVTPRSGGSQYRFEWGTTTNYGATSIASNLPAGRSLRLSTVQPPGMNDGSGYQQGFAQVPSASYFFTNFTVEGWVFVRAHNSYQRLIDFGFGDLADNVDIWLNQGPSTRRLLVRVSNNYNMTSLSATQDLPTNQWVHVACVLNGTIGTIYLNGSAAGSGTLNRPRNISRASCYIGRGSDSVVADANADFDELRIWNVALSQSTLQNWNWRQVDSSHPNFANLEGYWKFNETSGTTAADSSGKNRPATLYNSQASFAAVGFPSRTAVSHSLTNLVPAQTYHFRVVEQPVTTGSPTYGSNQAFTTVGPSFGPLTDVTMPEDTTRNVDITLIDVGTMRPITIAATSSVPWLTPAITYVSPNASGTLLLIPARDVSGSAQVTVTMTVDYGTGSPAQFARTFNVTVQAVNDTPIAGSVNAARFDGTNAQVQVSGFGASAPVGEITVEFWARPMAASNQITFTTFPSQDTNSIRGLVPWGNSVFWDFGNRADYSPSFAYQPAAPLIGQWHHFAFVASAQGSFMRIYRNGVLEAEKTSASTFKRGTYELIFGGLPGAQWSGDLDEFRVWNTVRTPDQIRRNLNMPLAGDEVGLGNYWRFDETNAFVAFDSSASPLHGRLVNGAAWTPRPDFMQAIVDEDTPRDLFLPAYDVDGGQLTFSIVAPPANGSLSGLGPRMTYMPNTNYQGADSFTYKVRDAAGAESALATYSLIVNDLNDLPQISTIPNQSVLENRSSTLIPFAISDAETPASQLELSVRSSDQTLVRPADVRFSGTDTNRFLQVTPRPNEIGTVTLTVTVVDAAGGTTETSFNLAILPQPAYAVIEVGALPGRPVSEATAINELGTVVGYAARNESGLQPQAFIYSGLESGGELVAIDTIAGATSSQALGVNEQNQVTGVATDATGARRAFIYDGITGRSLGTLAGGSATEGAAINAGGIVAGSGDIAGGFNRAFANGGSSFTNLGTLAGDLASFARGINNSNHVVGYSLSGDGRQRAFLWTTQQGMTDLGSLGGTNCQANSLNEFGQVVGRSQLADGQMRAFLYADGSIVNLGTLASGGASYANDINTFGQVVGAAFNSNGVRRATLYSAGELHDLTSLLPDDSGWTLTEARAINNRGEIVGVGINPEGQTRAFLAVPANVIGKPLARPLGAVARLPEIVPLGSSVRPDEAFYWSPVVKKLYAIRPVTARLSWFVSEQDSTGSGTNFVANTNRVISVGLNVWPRDPTMHVVGTPVEVEPRGVPFNYNFQSILYATTNGVTVDPSSKTFNAVLPGYTVLHYLRTDGFNPDPQVHPPVFDVVRSVAWNNPRYLVDAVPWQIGETLTDPGHFDYLAKGGYVWFAKAPVDGFGEDKAYDRNTRLGAIIPVNRDSAATDDDLVAVWFRTNRLGVAWGGQPKRYSLAWPFGTTNRIVIASGLGSGELPPASHPEMRVYHQPDPGQIGYNPNEEHAFIVDNKLFALRNDLNAAISPRQSEAFALLKYREPATGKWAIRAYEVVAEQDPWFFRFQGEAGKEIQPPLPLSAMQLCTGINRGVRGPFWRDVKGKLYARAAGPEGSRTNVVIQWFYPLQPGFFYDLNLDGRNDVDEGTCVAWLDRRPAGQLVSPNDSTGSAGTPVEVVYDIRWPDEVPVLQVGETLLNPKAGGLPGVKNWAKAEIVFDTLNPFDTQSAAGMARLYDPLSSRTVAVPAGFQWPTAIERVNLSGKEYFPGLPFHLKQRLTHDPINRTLSFTGYLDEQFSVGPNPLLLPNVMSVRERDRIQQLDGTGTVSTFDQVIEKLYQLTRNPNRLDLNPVNGVADDALLIGLRGTSTNAAGLQIGGPVAEQFGSSPKALTAALSGVVPAQPRPGAALRFAGTGSVTLPSLGELRDFTISLWARINPTNAGPLFSTASGNDPGLFLRPEPATNRFVISDRLTTAADLGIVAHAFDTGWHHYSLTRDLGSRVINVFMDGQLLGTVPADGWLDSTGLRLAPGFSGDIDEVQVWSVTRTGVDIRRSMNKRLSGAEDGLLANWRFDEGSGATAANATTIPQVGTPVVRTAMIQGATWFNPSPTEALYGIPPRFLTLAENNDPNLPGLPVTLHILRVDDGPYTGDLKVLPSDNVFDERITLRHSSDFAGDPGQVEFEWYYKPQGQDFDPTDLPVVNQDTGEISDPRGWLRFATSPASGQGVNDVTIGEGGEAGLLVLSDNGFICRYRGFAVNLHGVQDWSDWVGDPAGTGAEPRAALAEGWVKRVLRGLNPFDARTADFHSSAVNTYGSMLIQAGQRYEGPIAFNPSADAINSIGLIEAYTTVLRRARGLSVEGLPPVDFGPANNALLLAAGKIADLYILLGNEAYADAQDPTIGFGTGSSEYGSVASSIFAFQNQLDSLLDEELVLLRGRDDRNAGIGAAPVYNRLLWNFTLGEGEVAYQQAYNIRDQNGDGFIDERDARILYPQGHGDAWGHYLTAIKTYYDLLRHPSYTWIPRSEFVSLAGTAVEVDFLDERKFANAAAAKAKAGREIVDLTYRRDYVEDPAGQWQGYEDTDKDRAWGVTEWGRRAGQGAYLDWLVGNAILPSTDPNTNHAGIQKIDRQTVVELAQIPSQYDEIQARLDQADIGLNPLGLAKGVVPFDIDPSFLAAGGAGLTHYEQIEQRAVSALNNVVSVWNEANRASQMLRGNQDALDEFAANNTDQERDYRNRLIEIFGYPYAGDIGAGKTYPSGYDGPDLYHYMYVNTKEITGSATPTASGFTAFFSPIGGLAANGFFLGLGLGSPQTNIMTVTYPQSAVDYAFTAPASWGQRRAPGELQLALSDLVQAEAQLKIALLNHNSQVRDIEAAVRLLAAQRNLNAGNIRVLNRRRDTIIGLNTTIGVMKAAQLSLRRASSVIETTVEAAAEAPPKSLIAGVAAGGDLTSAIRSGLKALGIGARIGLDIGADVGELAENALELSKDQVNLQTEIDLQVASQNFEVLQQVKALEQLVRNEAALRLEAYNQREVVQQTAGRYFAALAAGQRVIDELVLFRKNAAAEVQEQRYRDMTYRIFRNDALQKYRAQFDLAARYVFLAATAYDYESNLLGTDNRAGQDFLTDIIRQRGLGQMVNGLPVAGQAGLADPLARLSRNFAVLKPQLGLNNPQIEGTYFSLRSEMLRMRDSDPGSAQDSSDADWRNQLLRHRVANLWDLAEFRRYCRPFAPEILGPQPGLVIPFHTTVTFGLNFFGWPLSGGDSSYDPSRFATKVRSVGIWFRDYNGAGLSSTPRVYLVPVGMDVLRSPSADDFSTRQWKVIDQSLPVPFPIGSSALSNPDWIPQNDSLGGTFAEIRRYSSLRAYHDAGFTQDELTADSRLIGRSVWNTDWLLIVPGGTLLNDPDRGLDVFINSNSDIKIFFETYSYSGN